MNCQQRKAIIKIVILMIISCLGSVKAALPSHSNDGMIVAPSVSNITNVVTTNNQMFVRPRLRIGDLKIALNRILNASLDRDDEGITTTTTQKTKSLARTLSSLQPTWISGLLWGSDEGALRSYNVDDFQVIRKEVLASNPRCKFDITVNSSKYPLPAELISRLQEINAKLAPDILIFAVPSQHEIIYPSALAKGIEFVHAHGQLVGYEGPTSMIPDGIDFIVVRTSNLEVHREELSALKSKHHLPIVVKIPASQYGHDMRHSKHLLEPLVRKEEVIRLTHLAEDQNSMGYHFAYPINGLPSKLASADEVQGVDGAQKLSVQKLLDASSTDATKQFTAEVEVRKKSNNSTNTSLTPSAPGKDNTLLVTLRALMARFN
ncbi:MAG: hypothetical protein A3F67_06105 [Verrucomicrobia bacterium RIFCSPHIGHO2_12_FULL_41_10]|nr:MAG: hypothetical protein A3F67_06105 [Verrucomicrobia bacterium RIFCSPHIGHO2_12_FULL_41_10]HLB32671.1 hypothetical protein [Chthoniobacterales bacterium]